MMSASYGSTPHTFPPFQHPSHELLRENGFVWTVYHKYHAKCLKGKVFYVVTSIEDTIVGVQVRWDFADTGNSGISFFIFLPKQNI